jgi:hypothetical protein
LGQKPLMPTAIFSARVGNYKLDQRYPAVNITKVGHSLHLEAPKT